MTVKDLIEKMNLTVFCGEQNLDREIKGGYVSDLLSDVMGFAQEGNVWVTLQTHKNVIAIASLKELACVVLVKGNQPDIYPVYLAKACLAGDIDNMEKFGIYEVLPEDLALCEYVDPSKNNIQEIISNGINLMIKEMA